MIQIKNYLKNFIEQRPVIWKFAWTALQSSDYFLPHDPTYFALPLLLSDERSEILDIGANQGISALSFRKLCPFNSIISFEPNIALEVNLKKISKRIQNFQYHMCGLGESEGEFLLYVPRYNNIYLHTFSSLDHSSLKRAIIDTYKKKIYDKIKIEKFICKIRTLDSFNYKPQVIKVDAEGFEEKIFIGGDLTLREHMPAIIFEAVHGSVDRILIRLKSLGYFIISFDLKKQLFIMYDSNNSVPYISGSRNLIAVSENTLKKLIPT